MHRNLGVLFALIVRSPSEKMALAIWYSTDSDYAQRKMLHVAVEKATHLSSEQICGILWAINRIDDSLRHHRNDAMHAPLAFLLGTPENPDAPIISMTADPHSPNPRAVSLFKKTGLADLRKYLKEQEELAHVLAAYIAEMGNAIKDPVTHAWPDKPKLPRAHQTKTRKRSSHRNTDK